MFMRRVFTYSGVLLSAAAVKRSFNFFDDNSKVKDSDAVLSEDYLTNYKSWREEASAACEKWDDNWDKLHAQFDPLKKPIKRHILLVRHGQYNTEGKGDNNRSLTDIGRLQARLTGEWLNDCGFRFDIIIQSSKMRAKQTAEIIASFLPKSIPVQETSLLAEGAPYPIEPPQARVYPEYHYFTDGPRIEAAFRRLFHRPLANQESDSCELVVCHGNVIRYFVCRALQLSPDAWLRFSLDHCSITWLTVFDDGQIVVRRIGDSFHLQNSLQTRR